MDTAMDMRTGAERAANLQAFRAGGVIDGRHNFRGGDNEGTLGRLPREWRSVFEDDANAIDYVVYSYLTPIAWHTTTRGWTIPPLKYSVSTTRHQGTLWRLTYVKAA